MDQPVLEAQRWVNSVYEKVAGYRPILEDGRAGRLTVRALVRALRHELGVTPGDEFGPETLEALAAAYPMVGAGTSNQNIIKIVQCGLSCKGYDGGGRSGAYDSATGTGVTRMRADMGVDEAFPPNGVSPKVFQGLLSTDSYVPTTGGSQRIRQIQKWLNGTYVHRRDFPIIPCDGHFSREVHRSLLLGIQFEIGMDDDAATGRFDPGIQEGIRDQAVLGPGATDVQKRFVRLFQAAMVLNGWDVPFDGEYSTAVADKVAEFQGFARLLPDNGIAGYQTWASLLASDGDPTRRGTACDCLTEITPARAFVLKVEGYLTVGRYLTDAPGPTQDGRPQPDGRTQPDARPQPRERVQQNETTQPDARTQPDETTQPDARTQPDGRIQPDERVQLDERIQPDEQSRPYERIRPGELETIASGGLSAFPIYQAGGRTRDYFSAGQGAEDALTALETARGHGFARGTTIYFAVGFDALDSDIEQRIIPHFRALATRMRHYGGEFKIGVYGPRDVCGRLAREGLTVSSFVADRPAGFGGNLGFPLPADWAFDQISMLTLGTGPGSVQIGNAVASGRDPGQSLFVSPTPASGPLDVHFDLSRREELLDDLRSIAGHETPVRRDSTDPSLDLVLRHDALITGLSRAYRMRKALIQSPIFWETRWLTPEDAPEDLAVTAYYGYRAELEAWQELPPEQQVITAEPTPPSPQKDDARTGLGRMLARSAITAHNHAVDAGLVEGERLDPDDWHVMRDMWRWLREDPDHNISTVPLMLVNAAHEAGVEGDLLAYDDARLSQVMARYRGTGPDAERYGRELPAVYAVFEKHNACLR